MRNRAIKDENQKVNGLGNEGGSLPVKQHGVGWTGRVAKAFNPEQRAPSDVCASSGVGWTGLTGVDQVHLPRLMIRALWVYDLDRPETLPSLGLQHLISQIDD
ncbi:MAG: hypothetical protein P9M14_11955 [Candidatus Alcyoniella australis]|nr:hypothetical protein [Candidatus Alcyoniella australis]